MTARPEMPERKKDDDRPRDLYTVAECCRRNSISKATLYRLLAAGSLRAVKVGTRTLVTAESVQTWRASLYTTLYTTKGELGGHGQRQPETPKARKRPHYLRLTDTT